MKLTNTEIDILQTLVQKKLNDINQGPDGIEVHLKPEVLEKIRKKLDTMYFE